VFSSFGVGGAEIELSLLFADVRGSTTLAESMTPSAFGALMNEFYEVAAETLIDHDAVVDKFVGDAAVGLFIPGMTGSDHARLAVRAAERLITRTAEGGPYKRLDPVIQATGGPLARKERPGNSVC